MKKQYWAVGLNFSYTILASEPDSSEYGSVAGPFPTLKEAKAHVREWIKSDRDDLSNQLATINALTEESVD